MQENEYMTIRTAIEGARNTYQTDQHVSCTKCDKLEKTLAKQGHTLKKLKCIQYAFLAMAFVFLLATIGILIYELELVSPFYTIRWKIH